MANILLGTNSAFKIVDAAGTERDMTTFWLSGMPNVPFENVDVTAMGDIARRNNPGLQNPDWTVSLQYGDTGTASPWYVFNTLNGGAVTTAKFYPRGDSAARPELQFQMRVNGITFGGGPGEQETMEVTMVPDGTWTIGTV